VNGGVDCPVASGRPRETAVSSSTSGVEYSRFYSVRLFDGTRAQFTTEAGATAYDAAGSPTTTWSRRAPAPPPPPPTVGTWPTRTPSTSGRRAGFMNDGRVIWSTLQPNPVQTLSCSSTLPLDTAYTYQADATGGSIQCGSSGGTTSLATTRFTTRAPTAPQPALVLRSTRSPGRWRTAGCSSSPAPAALGDHRRDRHDGDGAMARRAPAVHDCRHAGNCSN
jgi:hypothetical protein